MIRGLDMRKTQTKTSGISREDENTQVEQAVAGNEKAMQAILARYWANMHTVAMRICKDPDRAEDVRQEACILVSKKLSQFSRTAALGGWIAMITRNCALQNLRQTQSRNQRETTVDEIYEGSSDATPEAMVGDRQMLFLMNQLLASLHEDNREMFRLRFVEDLSMSEVADRMNLSAAALKTRFHRARQYLREVNDLAEAA